MRIKRPWNKKTKGPFAFIMAMTVLLTVQSLPSMAGVQKSENLSELSENRILDEKAILDEEKPNDEEELSEEEKSDGETVCGGDLKPGENKSDGESNQNRAGKTETAISENSVSTNSGIESSLSQNSLSQNSAVPFSEGMNRTSDLDASVLEEHIVPGLNPEQAVVNLFDYWKKSPDTGEEKELDNRLNFYEGISEEHLLVFGDVPDVGAWNRYDKDVSQGGTGAYKGIVQNRLGEDGFPRLNFADKAGGDFEKIISDYAFEGTGSDVDYRYPEGFPNEEKKTESLDYLFSTTESDNLCKAAYTDVHGLFQVDKDGYYYYNSEENFAEYDEETNCFILYDSPGVGTGGDSGYYGEFFPFNKGTDVFDTVYEEIDESHPHYLSYEKGWCIKDPQGASFLASMSGNLNHYMGFTLEVPFLQPENGLLNGGEEMTFNFSGDDDVWIFIDNILVADLGGIHRKQSLSINFHTGEVWVEGNVGSEDKHTLRESFEAAYGKDSEFGGVTFFGNTFADNTVHSLKMFYMERGHNASNLSLNFNIQIARYNQIKKVNQNGDSLHQAVFALYPAKAYETSEEGRIPCNNTVSGTPCYVEQEGEEALITFAVGADGEADFIDQTTYRGYSFGKSLTNYYILQEIETPEGYRKQPVDIVLEYNPDTTMLSVANRWGSGSYASFTSYVNEWAGREMSYGQYDVDSGFVEASEQPVSGASRKGGLVLAVPMLKRKQDDTWLPLYGSNIDGFHTMGAPDNSAESMRKALLKAALTQCLYEEGWYLEWREEKNGLEGELSDLPGRADRYRHVNPDGDMRMVYIIIEPNVFRNMGINEESSAERYKALKQYVQEQTAADQEDVEVVIGFLSEKFYGSPVSDAGPGKRNVSMLDTEQFMRTFRSLIYVSNEQRELRVKKVDEKGKPLNGAVFGIYDTKENAEKGIGAIVTGTTATVDGEDGMLIFTPQADGRAGYAKFVWASTLRTTYYLKEIYAPDGYEMNETVIPVVIGIYSIYADAGDGDDGVSVMAGVGKLYRTMMKYASDGDVNITLRDITAIAQQQEAGRFALDGWMDIGHNERIHLHYGSNIKMGMDYGRHDKEKDQSPFFETDAGFLRTRVIQHTEAFQSTMYDEANNTANWDDLADEDLTGLFCLLNVVVVEDLRPNERRELRVLKVDENSIPLNGAEFGLYKSMEDAQVCQNAVASGITARVQGEDGILVFNTQKNVEGGYAWIRWKEFEGQTCYLKEVSAPKGYKVNETIVSIYIDKDSVYVDAGAEGDGIFVMEGVGQINVVVVENQKIEVSENLGEPEDSQDMNNPKYPERPEYSEDLEDLENSEENPRDIGTQARNQDSDYTDFSRKLGIPQTGDDSMIWLWILLSVIAFGGITISVGTLVWTKKEQMHKEHKKQRSVSEKRKR